MSQVTPEVLARYQMAIGGGSRLGSPPPTESRYENLNIYDSPELIISQLIGGDASWSSVVNSILNQDKLSPDERKTLAQRLFPNAEKNAVLNAAANVVTNPWVWFYFVTSPVGGAALRSGGSLFSVKKDFSIFAAKSLGWAQQNLLAPLELFGEAGRTFAGVTKTLHENATIVKEILTPAEIALRNKLDDLMQLNYGRKGNWKSGAWLVPEQYAADSLEFQMLEEVNFLLGSKKSGAAGGKTIKAPGRKMDVYVRSSSNREWTKVKDPLEPALKANRAGEEIVDSVSVSEAIYREELNRIKSQRAVFEEEFWRNYKTLSKSKKARMWEQATDRYHSLPVDERPVRGIKDGPDAAIKELLVEDNWRKSDLFREVERRYVKVEGVSQVENVADEAVIDQMSAKYGKALSDYSDAVSKANKWFFVRSIGDEAHYAETGLFKVDDDKLGRMASSLNREVNTAAEIGATTWEGKEALIKIFGVSRLKELKTLKDIKAQVNMVRNELKDLVSSGVDWEVDTWMSRNTYSPFKNADGSVPLMTNLDIVQRKALDLTPTAASQSLIGKGVAPISEKEVLFHVDYLNKLEKYGALTEEGVAHRKMVLAKADSLRRKGETMLGYDPSRFVESTDRGFRNFSQLHAIDTGAVSAGALLDDADRIARLDSSKQYTRTKLGVAGDIPVSADLKQLTKTPETKISNGDVLERMYVSMPSASAQQLFRDVAIPNALGNAGSEYLTIYNSHIRTREMAGSLANSFLGKTIEKFGGKWGKEFVGRLREIGDFSKEVRINNLSDTLAKYLYVSHLGINIGSVLLNMTQPLLLAASVADNPLAVMKAYGKAFSEMGTYASKRIALGLGPISDDVKLKLIRESFSNSDVLGIGPDMWAALDSHLSGTKGSVFDRTSELMLKGFEKTEWLNRVVSGHLLEGAYKAAGRSVKDPSFLSDLQRFVSQTQFAQSDLNTPLMFQRGILSNRLMRQFFTFPVRSLTGATMVFPKLGESDYVRGAANMFFRSMGLSAMVYEGSKGLFGVDVSRGLFAGSLTAVAGGDRMLDPEQSPIPVPPVVSIPIDFIRGVAADDAKLLQSSIARMVPGGVAINRAMGFLPEMPRSTVGGFPGSLQQQSVGWDQMQNGMVPVYDERGSLIEYRSPTQILLKAFGADLGKWANQGELDNWLMQNRPKITQMRHEYLRAEASNDFGRAAEIRASFERKFGFALTVNDSQRREFARSRVTSRTERILDMYPDEARKRYAGIVAASGGVPMFDRATIAQGGTASSRDELRPGGREAIEEQVRRMQNVGPAATTQGAFTPFAGFN